MLQVTEWGDEMMENWNNGKMGSSFEALLKPQCSQRNRKGYKDLFYLIAYNC